MFFDIKNRRLLLVELRSINVSNRLKAVRKISSVADTDPDSFLRLEKDNPIVLVNIISLLRSIVENDADDTLRSEANLAVGKIRTIIGPKVGKSYGCTKCGSRMHIGWKYCGFCGDEIHGWDRAYSLCTNCGHPIAPEWTYCTKCKTPTGKKMLMSCPKCGESFAPSLTICPNCGHWMLKGNL